MYFRDLIGHGEQVQSLQGALAAGRLPHALLFAGPRGVGKDRVARAFVAARFCESETESSRSDGCGECRSCRSLVSGNHPDFGLVERAPGKRDVSIDQIRELLQFLHHKPHWGSGRAAIIDDAHRLTLEAQNAFLKTLEEPPSGAMLIIVTPQPERLLPTVHSRCSLHRFGPLSEGEMLRFIGSLEDHDGKVPASLADGSPGMMLRLNRGDVVAAREVILRFVTQPDRGSPYAFAADLLEQASVSNSSSDGEEEDAREQKRIRIQLFLKLLAFALRDLQVVSFGLRGAALFHSDHASALVRGAEFYDPDALFDAGEACEKATADLFRNVDPALLLEQVAAAIRASASTGVRPTGG